MKKKFIIRQYTESAHQKAIIAYSKFRSIGKYKLIDFLIKIHNEGRKSLFEAIRDKSLGIKAGVSDLFLAFPSRGYHGMWVEVKSDKGKLSKLQKNWFDKMQFMKYYTVIVRNLDDFIREIDFYLDKK